jgi:hypothetical protein
MQISLAQPLPQHDQIRTSDREATGINQLISVKDIQLTVDWPPTKYDAFDGSNCKMIVFYFTVQSDTYASG